MMKVSIFLVLVGLTAVLAESRSKRAAYDLPDGAELLVNGIRTTFFCSNDGYYADIDNDCKIFHVCHTVINPDGGSEMLQWSFLCGNLTMFNQLTFTCASPEDAVPCSLARDFFYLNANLGAGPNVPFLNDQDVARAAAVTPGRAAQAVFRPVAPARPPPPQRPFRG